MNKYLLILFFIFCALATFSQTKGLIYKPAGAGKAILDPNLDGYTSTTTNGFISEDESESEIPYTPLPSVGTAEPDSDLGPGPSCGFTDLVKSDDNHTIYTYLDASDNLMFRFRLGGTAENSKAYSILIDTDQKFGASGDNADPNYTIGNPGFEIEVVLRTNFGVGLYDIDGTIAGTEIGDATVDRPYDDFAQKSIAHSEICGDDDYFYDFYIPFADITSAFPSITTSTALRMVGQTVINPKSAIGNNGISDLGGIDDNIGITDGLWEDLIDVFPPTSLDDIGSGTTIPPRASCPAVTAPIAVGTTSVSGTSLEENGATIELFRAPDGVSALVSVGTTTVSSGSWIITGLTAAAANEVFKATASVSAATATSNGSQEKSASYDNCNVSVVGATCANAPIITGSTNKGVQGTYAGFPNTSYTIELYTSTGGAPGGTKWDVGENPIVITTDGIGNATFDVNCGTGNCITNDAYYVTAISSSECESNPSNIECVGVAGSTIPAISTTPILETTTSISGSSGSGADIALFIDGISTLYTTTASGTGWTISGITGLSDGQAITVFSTDPGGCPSESTAVLVQSQSAVPIITDEFCTAAATQVTTVNGISSEIGATIKIFLDANVSAEAQTAIVPSNGRWTVTGLSINTGSAIRATATNTGELESDKSSPNTVNTKTPDPTNQLTLNGPISEGDASISGTTLVSATDAFVIQLYLDGIAIDGATYNVGIGASTTTWTITGLNTPFDKLFAGGVATVTITNQTTGFCESDPSNAVIIDCKLPASQTFSASSATTICENETIDFTISNTESLIVYELVDQDGNGVGPAMLGDGTALNLTTFALSASVTSVAVKAQKIGITCETIFTPAIVVDVKPLAVVSLSANNLQVCKGASTVNLSYSVTTNGPAIDYSIDFDGVAEAAGSGFVDIIDNSTVGSPIAISVPVDAPAGTYNAAFTVRNSNSVVCTSEPQAFTVTVVDAKISSVSSINPTTCAGVDGTITISGLATSTSYTALDYLDDGDIVNHGAFTSDASGEYIITGMDAGSYADFEVTILGCTSSTFEGPVTLSDPGGAIIAEGTHTQPTSCSSPNGEIVLTGVSTGTYSVDFTLNGISQPSQTISATASGIAVTGLDVGTYANISITDGSSCQSNTIAGPINLVNSSSPTITLGTNPSVFQGTTSASLPYTATTNSPDQYTIDYDVAAEGQGFADITPAVSLTTSPIALTVPGGAAVGGYNGTITVVNSATGCSSAPISFTITITSGDVIAPSLDIQGEPSIVNSTDPFTVTIEFDEDVVGFDITDINVGNGSVSNLIAIDGNTFTVSITPDGTGDVTIDVPANSAQDLAGNNNTVALQALVTYDDVPPANPTTDSQITNDSSPVISGGTGTGTALNAGETMTVTINGATYSVIPDASGNWSIDLETEAPSSGTLGTFTDGTYQIITEVKDEAGNIAIDATTDELTVDTSAPTVPVVDSKITNDTSPVITGSTGIGAALPAGETMTVEINGAIYTVVPDASGNWTIDLETATPSSGTLGTFVDGISYDIIVTVEDAAGNSITDGTTNEIRIDTSAPATPTVTSQNVCNGVDPVITGTSGTGAALNSDETLMVEVNGANYTVIPTASGNWSIDTSSDTPSSGTLGSFDGGSDYVVTARVSDSASNESSTSGTISIISIPNISLISSSDPTACGGMDGKINLSFTNVPNDIYTITYLDGSAVSQSINNVSVTSNSATLNVEAGTYNDISITILGCTSTGNVDVTLTDPLIPTISITSSSNPTTCGGDGSISLGFTNVANGSYSINHLSGSFSNVSITSGTATIGVGEGTYTDLSISVNGCTSTENPDVTITEPTPVTIAFVQVNDPTSCSGSDGSIEISGLDASTTYTVDYSFEGSAISTTIMSDGSGALEISGLGEGDVGDVSVTAFNCTSNELIGPFTLNEPVTATIAIQSFSNPTTCAGADGEIVLNGFENSLVYDLTYKLGGTLVTVNSIASESDGTLVMSGLSDGNYTDFQVSKNSCISNLIDGPVALADPTPPTISSTVGTDPSTCAATNGSIDLNGLNDADSYNVSYTKDATTTNINGVNSTSGTYVITGLDAGSYSNISVVVVSSGCQSNIIPSLVLNPPDILLGTLVDPSTCSGTEGSMQIRGLAANTIYDLNYDLDGVGASTASITSDADGEYIITGLSAGAYTVMNVTNSGCVSNNLSATLTDPTSPVIALGALADPTTCGGTDGRIQLTGLIASTEYTVKYFTSGIISKTITSDGFGNLTLTDLSAEAHTAINATIDGCTSNDLSVTLNAPPSPTVTLGANPEVCFGDTNAVLTYSAPTNSPNRYKIDFDGAAEAQGFTDILNAALGASPINITVPTSAASGGYNAIFTVLNSSTECSTDYAITVTVNAPPALPTVDFLTTNNTSPSVTGTADASNTVVVEIAGATYNTVATAAGQWAIDTSLPDAGSFSPNVNGINEVTVTVSDGSCTNTDNSSGELIIDTADPKVPTVVSQVTNDPTPMLKGTAEPGSTVTVVVGGATYVVVADGSGNWLINTETETPVSGSFSPDVNGTNEVSVTSEDAAGNSTTDTTTLELVIDVIAPANPTVVSQTTVDTTPVITGTAEAGSLVEVVVGGATYLIVADASGNWSINTETVTPSSGVFAPNVNGTNEVIITSTDAAGNSSSDTSTLELIILSGDADGDGVPDSVEDVDGDGDPTNDDSDGDGTPDYLDGDDDGDGVDTTDEDVDGDGDPSNDDTDGDGTPDYLDDDDDGDGIGTADEDLDADGDSTNDDTDGDGTPDYLDEDDDGDGLNTEEEDVDGDGDPTNDDSDGDGDPDYLDEDDDGDGILTEDEDTDGDGDPTNDDCDGDTEPNYLDTDSCDTDGDGILDNDEDTDGDGDPYNDDCDGDTIPNFLDPDPCDTDGDGILDNDEDTDVDGDPYNDDCDGDTIPNFLDPDPCDTDGDGILDNDEDTDGDGDPYNDDCDGDTIPNFLDPDSCDTDGDGILDNDEDTDGDGDPYNDDCDADGIPNFLDPDTCDTDGDGIDDSDEDTDGDGDPTNDDCDADGIPNFQDTDPCDTDGDGIDDDDEDTDGDGNPYNDDCDEDGTPNFQDPDPCDTDGDGLDDQDEDTDGDGNPYNDDCDEDGVPNFQDSDACTVDVTPRKGFTPEGNGENDFFYIQDIENYPNNTVQIFNRWGNKLFEVRGYNNEDKVWRGNANFGLVPGRNVVPDGTYFYLIDLGNGRKPISGFVVIRR
ncbi:gliding motility-associated C-terminal domain-containing protein [Ekhidna sp.]|uniref:T9SS type B sorting domain-containing protein n=1 Tax=Ekhidna sp. TaxID=2608089 RepID=UPI003296B125